MKKKQALVLVVTLLSLFGEYWINAGKTSLKTTGEVAGREEVINYTLPPDFIFSIWGVIYFGFVIYAFYGLKKSAANNVYMNNTAYPVAISIFLNLVWTVLVGAEFWVVAYFLQWLMLVISIIILYRWQLDKQPLTALQKYMSIPFGLYAGWLTVAMIPFTSDLLNKTGWDYAPFPQQTWGMIIYVVACLIVLLALRRLRQPFYLIPLAWALFGFAYRFDGNLSFVASVLCGLMVAIFIAMAVRFYRK